MKLNFEHHKDVLFKSLLDESYEEGLLNFIDRLHKGGHTKRDIYELFLEFIQEIQVDSRTKNNEDIFDRLADFMDGFTAWGGNFRILPSEPDI